MNSSGRSSFSSSRLPSLAQTAEVLELLRSNHLPVDPPGFRSAIASCLADLTCYDLEIERLVAERDALKHYYDQCRSVFAPVKRLPSEILVEIFTLCSSTPRLYCDWIPPTKRDTVDQLHPMNLSQVCSSWRKIVEGTPSLWSNIEIDFERITHKGLTMAHLSNSLARSKAYPLMIHVNSWQESHCGRELLRNAARWRMADLCIDFNEENRRVFSLHIPGNLPHLERLELGGDCADWDIFEKAPKLTRVLVSDAIPVPRLPWSQLRELTYYASRPIRVVENVIAQRLQSMSRCSNHCEFNLYDLNISDFDLFTTATLFSFRIQSDIPILRLAILDENDEDHSRPILGAIIGTLVLPRLQELHFRSFSPDSYPIFWPRDDFMAFFDRSSLGNTLTKLFLYDMAITEDELVECLSEMQVLLELFIQDVDGNSVPYDLIADSLLLRLTWRDDSSCLVPHLHCFSFHPLFFSFEEDAFVNFVESRLIPGRASNSPFTVQAFFAEDHFFDDSTLARMTALHAEGRLRWSLQDREILRQKFSNIHLF